LCLTKKPRGKKSCATYVVARLQTACKWHILLACTRKGFHFDEQVLQACKVVLHTVLHKNCTTTLTPDVNISAAGYQVDCKHALSYSLYIWLCVSGSRGEENALAKSACLDRLSHGCTAPIEQMSSLYARATAARPKPSKTSRGRFGSIYLPAKSPLLRPLIASRAMRLCPSSRTWLRAVTFSLGGSRRPSSRFLSQRTGSD
jgi:hypothetical protein